MREHDNDYKMITERFPQVDAAASQFTWPIEDEAGRWESLDKWPRPFGGVRIESKQLCLEYRKPYQEGRGALEMAAADFKMLAEFANLADGDAVADGRLVRFALQYGGLGLCKRHGWPFAHSRPHCASDSEPTADGWRYRERIRDWLFFARLTRAILVAGTARDKNKREAALAELRTFIAENSGTLGAASASPPYRVILHWLQGGELKVWFRNRPPRLTLYGVPPLWTAIGLQLATLAVSARAIIVCSACGRIESAKRSRTSPNRRAYCSKCRDKGRKRQGVAAYRERVRYARELRGAGKNVGEIARLLGVGAEKVKRYLARPAAHALARSGITLAPDARLSR